MSEWEAGKRPTAGPTYEPRLRCRLNLHQGRWGAPYRITITSVTVIGGGFPRESTDTVAEEQRQDRVCVHCGCVTMRRLR
jgi:hypothetical protein